MPGSIGILGGTFDPVHNGHLAVARAALRSLALTRLLLIPNARSPLKSASPVASFDHRLTMLKLAISDDARLEACAIEGDRGSISYTVDTIHELKAMYPDVTLYLIVGGDSLRDFSKWRDHEVISDLASIAYVDRPGTEPVDAVVGAIRIEMAPQNVSSRDIRRRIHDGEPIADLVPRSVAAYIATHNLYQ